METTTVNVFLDRFIAVADSGFGLIQGDVSYVLNVLIVISITLAGVQWVLAQEAPMAPFFRKVLFVGFFAFLINNWNALSTAINQSGAMLGLRAGGDGLSMPDLHNPGRVAEIGVELFGKTIALSEGMMFWGDDAGVILTVFVSALAVALAFFVLALQIFIALIAFKIGALAAFVALPWGVFNGTSWVAERPIGWVVGSAIRLFVIALIASITATFVDALPTTFTLENGGALNVLLFGVTVLGLAWFGPHLASEVVQGQPNLAAAQIASTALVAGGSTYAVGRGALGMAGGALRLGAKGVGAVAGGARRLSSGRRSSPTNTPPIDHSRFQPPRRQ